MEKDQDGKERAAFLAKHLRQADKVVRNSMEDWRKQGGDKAVLYQQGQHVAIHKMFVELLGTMTALSEANREQVIATFKSAAAKRAALEARIAMLEARPIVSYEGTWAAGKHYRPGMFVTDNGSVWHCNRPTKARPGASPAWVLAVKRGRDGKA